MNRKAIGYEFDGGFEEYVLLPEILIKSGNVVKLPEDVSYTAGALIEPLACCIRGLKNAGTGFNDVVLIAGAGPIGPDAYAALQNCRRKNGHCQRTE